MSISKTSLDKMERVFGQLSQRELQIVARAIAAERKRCIDICEAEERKYTKMCIDTPRTSIWAGERGIGAGDCARKIADVAYYP